ncbi:7-carboxy-7-deazaguanine synthase QueE [Terrimonas sp. NA20]|uniref:7-carboxy-7-deazaguanine synthase n=1 Tax=Terrimonas ginsenosidimutans TaxID=2908004 RepID=A0ABS9KXU5_9BACT|nr:7-carboxy-7-deazaguanine synthase QueE [Terrimonas ginsenosidimutans]MCG2617131.1 7-carboxy-7-deazaguanine synthase QueE [Terrimonas ginsenosidimutans]
MEQTAIHTAVSLPVMEHFYTIQGEGFHQGRAAYFIRLGGCDVGCVWCDVKDSWEADRHPKQTIEQLRDQVLQTPAEMVVITGGEPLLHNLDELTAILQQAGLETNIETSGSSPLSGSWDWICLSPKKFKAPLPEVMPHANELKVIIYNKSDFAWGEKYAAQVATGCKLYLQPEWSKANEMTPLIVEYIKANPKWELSLQLHKYINVP